MKSKAAESHEIECFIWDAERGRIVHSVPYEDDQRLIDALTRDDQPSMSHFVV